MDMFNLTRNAPIFTSRAAPVAVAALVLVVRAAMIPIWGIPRPAVADEFSYILMADTFASGRLANEPHPMWRHFESMFILQQPTYASVYPVAQGVILAVGKLLTGYYWTGVWLSIAAMCGAICWMLRAWLPPKWALYGAMLAVTQIGIGGYWMNGYWGGAHAATAGALVLGAFRRIQAAPRVRYGILMGLGLAILANSRPWEGLAFSLPVIGALLIRGPRSRTVLLPASLILAVTAAGMMFYFRRVTGNPLRMPSQEYIDQYAATPAFVWQPLRPAPFYRHESLRIALESFLPEYYQYSTLGAFARRTVWKFLMVGNFFLGPLIAAPLLPAPWLVRSRRVRFLLLPLVFTLAAIASTVPFQPHYAAPATAVVFALTAESLRRLWHAKGIPGRIGQLLVPAVPLISTILLALKMFAPLPASPMTARADMEAALRASGGRHLVIVRYSVLHPAANEWIYNAADIDRAPVIWARDMGPEKNGALVSYMADRSAWFVEPDLNARKISHWAGN